MIESLLQLARPDILNLVGYSSARLEHGGAGLYLNANENPYPKQSSDTVHRYPQPQPELLRARLSQIYQVREEQILLTRGSDEGIDLWMRAFCTAGVDSIMVCPPTYDMYALCAAIQGANIISVPLHSEVFSLDIEKMLSAWQEHCKLICICSPNNPTGNSFRTEDILFICEQLKDKAIVIVDEAYIEFTASPSLSEFLDTYDNLVVLRTLSKAYGMAGARCGAVLAHPQLIQLIDKVISPYPLAAPVVEVISHELEDEKIAKVHKQIEQIKHNRETFSHFLHGLSYVEKVWPSDANFILLRVNNAKKLIAFCTSHHIIIRDRSHMLGLENCVRITIGTTEELAQLQNILEAYTGE